MKRILLTIIVVLATAVAALAGAGAAIAAPDPSTLGNAFGIYLLKTKGLSAGAPFARTVALFVVPRPWTYSSPNPFDICLLSGNPYAFSPPAAAIFYETTTAPICESQVLGSTVGMPAQYASVTIDRTSGKVVAEGNHWGGPNSLSGTCAANLGGANNNAFVGGSGGLASQLYVVCGGKVSLTFAADGAVSGFINLYGFGGTDFGTSSRSYVACVNGHFLPPNGDANATLNAIADPRWPQLQYNADPTC